MNDTQLMILLIGIIRPALTARGITAEVRQNNQPRQQGTPTRQSVMINKIMHNRYGYLGRADDYDEEEEKMIHTESQWIEATYQISTLAIQNPADLTMLTAADLANIVASILNSDAARAVLMAQNVGIERITNVRNPYFTDDKERYEASPSFDFAVTYEQVDVSEVPVLQSTEFNIIEV